MTNKYWGYHLTLDAPGADLNYIGNAGRIEAFAQDLVKRIDMVAYGAPVVVHFGSGNKAGYTLYQLIETSNISAHFVEDDGHGTGKGSYYLDVFSCKPFDPQTVVACAREYFGNTTETINFIERDAYASQPPSIDAPTKGDKPTVLTQDKTGDYNGNLSSVINKAMLDLDH